MFQTRAKRQLRDSTVQCLPTHRLATVRTRHEQCSRSVTPVSQWSLVELRRTGEYGVVSPRPSCASWIGVTRSTIRAPLRTRHSLYTVVLCHGTQASRRNHGLFNIVINTPLQLGAQASFNSNVSLSSFRARLLLKVFTDPTQDASLTFRAGVQTTYVCTQVPVLCNTIRRPSIFAHPANVVPTTYHHVHGAVATRHELLTRSRVAF